MTHEDALRRGVNALAAAAQNPRLAYVGVILAAMSWGTWSLFLRYANEQGQVAPALAAFIVFATIALVLLPTALWATRQIRARRTMREWGVLAAFGVSDALNCGLYFTALQTTTVAIATLTHYLAPLLVALAAPLVLREPRRPGTLLAAGIGLFGLGVLLAPWQAGSGGFAGLAGAGMGAASALFFAAGVFFNKRLSSSFEPSELLAYHMPSALLVLACFVPQGGWHVSTGALGWLVAGAIGPGALAGIVFVRSLKQVPTGRAAVLTLAEPLTALGVAALVWGETLGAGALAGAALVLGAAYLVVRDAASARVAPTRIAEPLPVRQVDPAA